MHSLFESWTPPLGTISTLLITAALYVRGFRRLHHQMPARFPIWRLTAFMSGIAVLLIAIASPLEEFDDQLLQVHMTQHLILMLIVPTLLLAGAPAIVFVRAIPPRFAKSLLGPTMRSRVVRRLFARVTDPIVCWLAFAVAFWLWH